MNLPVPLRLNILSDLHLSVAGLDLPTADADVVILAGDISRPKQAFDWALKLTKPVLYVAGNHEFYGNSISGTMADLKQRSQGTHIQILEQDQVVLQGVRFLGVTLWTDFLLYGEGAPQEEAVSQALKFIRDFSRIESDNVADAAFTPAQSARLFQASKLWLEKQLAIPFDGPTVVITHHGPSPQSVHPRFEGSAVNPCFVSNLEDLMGAERVALWIHGHTHDSFDYRVSGTRVVCNPRGYQKDGVNENALFNPNLVIKVG